MVWFNFLKCLGRKRATWYFNQNKKKLFIKCTKLHCLRQIAIVPNLILIFFHKREKSFTLKFGKGLEVCHGYFMLPEMVVENSLGLAFPAQWPDYFKLLPGDRGWLQHHKSPSKRQSFQLGITSFSRMDGAVRFPLFLFLIFHLFFVLQTLGKSFFAQLEKEPRIYEQSINWCWDACSDWQDAWKYSWFIV